MEIEGRVELPGKSSMFFAQQSYSVYVKTRSKLVEGISPLSVCRSHHLFILLKNKKNILTEIEVFST